MATKVEECTRRIKDIVIVCAQKAQKNDKLSLEEGSKVRVWVMYNRLFISTVQYIGLYKMERNVITL